MNQESKEKQNPPSSKRPIFESSKSRFKNQTFLISSLMEDKNIYICINNTKNGFLI
jgi:hypothetical protein